MEFYGFILEAFFLNIKKKFDIKIWSLKNNELIQTHLIEKLHPLSPLPSSIYENILQKKINEKVRLRPKVSKKQNEKRSVNKVNVLMTSVTAWNHTEYESKNRKCTIFMYNALLTIKTCVVQKSINNVAGSTHNIFISDNLNTSLYFVLFL